MLQIHIIPALSDNYVYLLRDSVTGKTAAIDPSEAASVGEFLQQNDWPLDYIWNTHHHWDHTGGNLLLKQQTGCQVVGFEGDAHRIPEIDHIVADNAIITLGECKAHVLYIPGHTLGHVAYWFADDNALFCGDTLFSLGCGRLFEGSPEQMFSSLQKLAALPADTRVFCGHEYTLANATFALTCEPENQALLARFEHAKALRALHQPTLPSTIRIEREANPFLRVENVEKFAEIRKRKDNFS